MVAQIEKAVSLPKLVRASRSDPAVKLFYDFCPETLVGSKWLCVVVKYDHDDAFVYYCLSNKSTESRQRLMADKVTVWFDAEADYLEVQFKSAPGHMKETTHDALMERVDAEGNVIGFSILGVSRFTKDKPLRAELTAA